MDVESKFAPLNPSGALPRSLSAGLVSAVYKGNVKRALKDAGVASRSIPRKKLLRNALNNPEIREKVGFAQQIYGYSRHAPWGKHIYARLIEPAESMDEKEIVLDPKKFEDLVEGFLGEQESPIEIVSHSSEWEALALIVIGYSITQPDDRSTLCQALCKLGPGFSDYLAIREAADGETSKTLASPGDEAEEIRPNSTSSTGPTGAEKVGKAALIDRASSSIEKMSLLNQKLAEHRKRRQSLGFAEVLDRALFDRSAEIEQEHIAALAKFENEQWAEFDRIIELAEESAKKYLPAVQVEEERPDDLLGITEWVDAHADLAEALLQNRNALDRALDDLTQIEGVGSDKCFETNQTNVSVDSLLTEIDSCRSQVEAEIFRHHEISASYSNLISKIADAIKPNSSSSLFDLSCGEVIGFLDHSRYNETLRDLTPFLIRHLGELSCWTGSETNRCVEVLARILEERATSGDLNDVVEALGCLKPAMIQEMLTLGNTVLTRAIVLSSLYMSFSDGNQIFFNQVWSSHSWEAGDREAALGNGAIGFLAHLMTLFGKAGGRIEALRKVLTEAYQVETGSDHEVPVNANRSTELAERLIFQPNIDNRFYELRRQAGSMYLERLSDAVGQENLAETISIVADINKGLESGALTDRVVTSSGGQRKYDATHILHLRRYVKNRIDEVQDWCSDFAALEAQRKTDRAGDERLSVLIGQTKRPLAENIPSECSKEWFERELRDLIGKVGSDQQLDRNWSNFGELAAIDSLFDVGRTEYRSVEWPVWMEPGPQMMSLWAGYVDGNVGWRQIYQDAVARLVLDRNLQPAEIVEEFLKSGMIEAANAACGVSEFAHDPKVGKLRPAVSLAVENRQTLADLLSEFDEVEGKFKTDKARKRLDAVAVELLELSEAIEQMSPQNGARRLKRAKRNLEKVLSTLTDSDDENQAARKGLIEWLAEAEVEPGDDESIRSLSERVERTKQESNDFRLHINALVRLKDQELPRSFRKALIDFIEIHDRPGAWPEAPKSEDAFLYIDQVVEQRLRWWQSLSAIMSSTDARTQLKDLDSCIEANLVDGVETILKGDRGRGFEFLLLFDRASSKNLQEFIGVLRHQGFLVEEQTERQQVPRSEEERERVEHPVDDAVRELAEILGGVPAAKGQATGGVADALVAIGDADYGRAERIVTNLLDRNEESELGQASRNLSIAIWSWARNLLKKVPDLDQLDKSLGIFFCYWDVIRKREHGSAFSSIVRDWMRSHDLANEVISNSLDKYLQSCTDDIQTRRRASNIVGVCGGRSYASVIWDAAAGKDELTASVRSKLLLLLKRLGDEEGIYSLFDQFTPKTQHLLRSYLVLIERAAVEQNADIFLAINQTFERIDNQSEPGLRPVKGFVATLRRELRFAESSVELEIVDTDRGKSSNEYSILLRLRPDLSDPPVSLRVWVDEESESADFRMADKSTGQWIVCENEILLESAEREFIVEAVDDQAAHSLLFNFSGSAVSGNDINGSIALAVNTSAAGEFSPLTLDELLEIYEGYDGKPVRGRAFVGRENELEAIRNAVASEKAGAIIIYGVRRIGKTSLLQTSADQLCASCDSNSNNLVLAVPVDSFNPRSGTGEFIDRFLRHITGSIFSTKNSRLLEYLYERGATKPQIQKAAKLDESDQGKPFADRLDIYMGRLCELAGPSVDRAIIAFDEFDKLLEAYLGDLVESVELLTNELRLVATEYDHIGLIIAGSELMRRITGQYRNALYGSTAVIELSCFDTQETFEDALGIIEPAMLQGRRDFELVAPMLIRMTGGHPLYMRLLACATSKLAQRNRVSPGLVNEAVRGLLANEILHGYIPDPSNTVRQPLQALSLMTTKLDEERARLLLYEIAAKTTLENPLVEWGRVLQSPNLEQLGSPSEWRRYRDSLREANLLQSGGKYQWGIRFPILAETMRLDEQPEIERLIAAVEELQKEHANA